MNNFDEPDPGPEHWNKVYENYRKKKWLLFPHRHIIAALVLKAGFSLYLLRINLSTAIIAMAKFNKTASNTSGDVCVTRISTDTEEHNGEFEWDESTQGVILGAFFYGYIMFQVIGGRLAEIFGAKWLSAGGIGMAIVINAFTPMIARSQMYWLLIGSRVVLGMFQAFIFPSSYALFSKWSPDHERSTVLALPSIGGNIGTIATSALSGYLADHGFDGGWPSVFYVSAMIACVWLIAWVVYARSEPKDHPWISHEERKYIESNIASNSSQSKLSVPWLKIFTSMPIIATIVVKFTINWNYVLFLLKLPAYLQTVFNMSNTQNGLITALVYTVLTISLFSSGFVADKIVQRKIMSKTLLRKIFESIATFGSALCLCAIPWARCSEPIVITLLMIGIFLFGMQAGGDIPVVADMTNNFAATVFSVANSIAFLCGVVTPLVAGLIVGIGDQPRRQWGYVFYMSAALNVFGGIVYIIFGSAEQQEWDKKKENEDDHNDNPTYMERI